MTDINKHSPKLWSQYVGTIVMAGVAIISVVDSGIAAALGNDAVARISLGTAYPCAIAALGSLLYTLWRGRRASS